jgi:hypothetical protein
VGILGEFRKSLGRMTPSCPREMRLWDKMIDTDGFRWPPTYYNWLILAIFQFGSFFLVFGSLTSEVVLSP